MICALFILDQLADISRKKQAVQLVQCFIEC